MTNSNFFTRASIMLDGYLCSGFREVEHIENDGFGTSVLASMDSADHFDYSIAFVESFLCSILANDGQFALLNDTVIDYCMMMPPCFGAYREVQSYHPQFGLSLWKIR